MKQKLYISNRVIKTLYETFAKKIIATQKLNLNTIFELKTIQTCLHQLIIWTVLIASFYAHSIRLQIFYEVDFKKKSTIGYKSCSLWTKDNFVRGFFFLCNFFFYLLILESFLFYGDHSSIINVIVRSLSYQTSMKSP